MQTQCRRGSAAHAQYGSLSTQPVAPQQVVAAVANSAAQLLGQSTHRRSLTVSTMRRLASSSSSTRRTTCGANGVDGQ